MRKNIKAGRLSVLLRKVPQQAGVYKFYDKRNRLLYIGKAVNLRSRVSSYFSGSHSGKISKMIGQIDYFKIIRTDSNIEALILESRLVRRYQPPYNSQLKDDKSFAGVFISKSDFPKVRIARVNDNLPAGEWFGPYTSATNLRLALKVVRKIFRWCQNPNNSARRPCFYYHIRLCSGACVGNVDVKEYRRLIKGLKLFLRGKKTRVVSDFKRQMLRASSERKFEQANRYKRILQALAHIKESSLVVMGRSSVIQAKGNMRIEAYDVANLGNENIVGAMVVNENGILNKSQYRRFKMKFTRKQDDVGAIKEMVIRRLGHSQWKLPDLIVLDGGLGHLNAVRQILFNKKIKLPIIGIAKGAKRKNNRLVGDISFITRQKIPLKTIISLRDEAHRFARKYHFYLRRRTTFAN